MECSILFHPVSRQCLHGENRMFLRGKTGKLGMVGNLNGMSTLSAMSINSLACITLSSSWHDRLVL
jgi:hypothetical protein